MKYGLVFLLLGLVCGTDALLAHNRWGAVLLGSVSVCFVSVGLGFLCVGPRVFLKLEDGRLSFITYAVYWPYLLFNWLSLFAIGRIGRENCMDEIVPNLFLGRWLTAVDNRIARERGFVAVLDLTAEFPRSPQLKAARHFKCIPLLDTYAPTMHQLSEGVQFLNEHVPHGPVYVHCAMGHGRSATFIAAYLIAAGHAQNVAEAEALIRRQRPLVGLHPGQVKALEAFMGDLQHAGR